MTVKIYTLGSDTAKWYKIRVT